MTIRNQVIAAKRCEDFSDPFYQKINEYPVRFAAPVFFGDSPQSSWPASLSNGTATLLRFRERFLAITCRHVLEGFRRSCAVARTFFQLGTIRMNPEAHLVSEDSDRDLAVFDLTCYVAEVSGLSEPNFVQPARWPPGDISTTDVICLAGFPGIWREQVGFGHMRFYSYSSGAAEVLSVTRDFIKTTVQIQDCIGEMKHGKVWGSLGGLSGGPVFVWRKTPVLVAELVGFISEYQESLDIMVVRRAGVIREDGQIV